MPRLPKAETGRDQTPASIGEVAKQLLEITGRIQAREKDLTMPPVIPSVHVLYNTSLHDGLRSLRTWVSALEDAVHSARLEVQRIAPDSMESPGPAIKQESRKKKPKRAHAS